MAYLYCRKNKRGCSLIGGSLKIIKSCSPKYKTRKFCKIFLKNGLYRFAVLHFSIFRLNSKMNVRMSFTVNTWTIYTLEQIREIVRWSAVRKKWKTLLVAAFLIVGLQADLSIKWIRKKSAVGTQIKLSLPVRSFEFFYF